MDVVGIQSEDTHLLFDEGANGHRRTPGGRVRNLAPQIWRYRRANFTWPFIKSSLEAIGIHLAEQTIRNLVSKHRNKSGSASSSTISSQPNGLQKRRDRPHDL